MAWLGFQSFLSMLHKLATGNSGGKLLLALLFWPWVVLAGAGEAPILRTEAKVMVEIAFRASHSYRDPFNQVTLDVIFSDPQGRELRVPAFWAGAKVWK